MIETEGNESKDGEVRGGDEEHKDSESVPPSSSSSESKTDGNVVSLSYGGVIRRGCAYCIDMIIPNVFVYWRIASQQGDDPYLLPICLLFLVVYFPLLEGSLFHATVGKLIMGLKVVDRDGKGIGILRSYFRFGSKITLGICTFFLAWIAAGFHPKKRAAHDLVARTFVVLR
ncbi:MAG: RDD family protein [Bdellovibrionota bacterium]